MNSCLGNMNIHITRNNLFWNTHKIFYFLFCSPKFLLPFFLSVFSMFSPDNFHFSGWYLLNSALVSKKKFLIHLLSLSSFTLSEREIPILDKLCCTFSNVEFTV